MGRQSNRKKKERQHSLRSSIRDHRKQGPKFVPPLNSVGPFSHVLWLRDVFPDMLWICSVLGPSYEKPGRAADLHDAIKKAAEPHLPKPESGPVLLLTGTLTSFEALPIEARQAVLAMLQRDGLYAEVCSEGFAQALSLYPGAPGSWLLEPWASKTPPRDAARGIAHLNSLIRAAPDGRSPFATVAKHMYFRGLVVSDRVFFAPEVETVRLLPRYPYGLTDAERDRVDAFVRASFLMLIDIPQPAGVPSRLTWAKAFWRTNWTVSPCEFGTAEGTSEAASETALETIVAGFEADCSALEVTFAAAAREIDPDLYAPDRYEVLTGIVGRLLRLVRGTISSPLLWSDEYGTPILRAVIESKLVFHWLCKRNDPRLYEKFKEYGRGHLKLHALHFREYVDSLDDPPAAMLEHSEVLTSLVNEEISEEFQDISIDRTFAGNSLRDMAIEGGLKRDYDLLFSPASAAFHGEWTALDRYALERCENPLHRWHRVPRRAGAFVLGRALVGLLLREAAEIVELYKRVIPPVPDP